ncbi:MAG: glycosyltransferase family 2 protein [Bacillota bacterium]|nr:glycosyltransferase family 2 protein [Bacillota bacterium]
MDGILEKSLEIFFLLLKIFSFYFAGLALFGLLKPKALPETEQRLKFAVLLPARNEESCIAAAVESILNQDYPPELVDVFVIPNNCSDDTEGAARRAGARILPVSPAVRSKGAALREGAAQLLSNSDHEAFCVFDADNEADRHFLSAMNRSLCGGARVAKSRILAKNAGQSWVCTCYEIYFCFANLFLNRARAVLGLSARLIGTGFGIRRDFLEEIGGFPAETITEDAELFALCAARGEKIAFCGAAITYDEEPLSFRTSLVQRRRWMSGIMQVTGLKLKALLPAILKRQGGLRALDACLQLCFGYVQALLPFALLLSWLPDWEAALAGLPLSLALGYGAAVAQALAALLLQKRFRSRLLPGILLYPLFLFSFIPLQSLALLKKIRVWQEIPHTGVRQFSAEKKACPRSIA